MVLSGGRLSVTFANDNKKGKKMNKYKIAMSCGKGFGIVKTVEKTWLDIVSKLSKHWTNDKESVGFLLVVVLMVLSVKMSFRVSLVIDVRY